MTSIELFAKMGECLRAIDSANDAVEREALIQLQRLWIELANKDPFKHDDDIFADEIAEVIRIHDRLMMALKNNSSPKADSFNRRAAPNHPYSDSSGSRELSG
jgi:hypothetical protein